MKTWVNKFYQSGMRARDRAVSNWTSNIIRQFLGFGFGLKTTFTPTKELLETAGYSICNNVSFNFFQEECL